MYRYLMVPVLAAACLIGPAVASERPAGAFNLRIVSDSVPDFSSRRHFVTSALSNWETEHDRSLAQFRWMHRCRRVGSYVPEDNRPVLDPVLFFNSYGITFCSMISQMNGSLWEARDLPFRVIDLKGHVVSEVKYDGAWHMFDNDFCNYFLTAKGAVASAADLCNSRIHGNWEDLKPGEYYLFDHCPTASSPRGRIFMGPSSWTLKSVAHDWYPGPGGWKPREAVSGAQAGHRYVLGVRPNETYTRFRRPLGTGALYARLFRSGKDPAKDGSPLRNSRANGRWVWEPDLSDPGAFFGRENVEVRVTGPADARRRWLAAKDPAKPAVAVFRVNSANVVTAADLEAEVVGAVRFTVSGNGGRSWSPVTTVLDADRTEHARITHPVSGRLQYLLRVEFMKGALAGLARLRLVTITQVNPLTLPALRLGANRIAAVSDDHLQYVILHPRLTAGQHAAEVHRAEGVASRTPKRDSAPSIVSTGAGQVILRARTPRDVRHVRMACTALLKDTADALRLWVSIDEGRSWRLLGRFGFNGRPYDRRVEAETRRLAPGVREVLLKYDLGARNALVNCVAEVGFAPAGPRMPYAVTYCWSEYRDGAWVERRHAERVTDAYHAYGINVGGARPPRMNWVQVAADDPAERVRREGVRTPSLKGPDTLGARLSPVQLGYSDGEDVGPVAAGDPYRLIRGRRLTPKRYTVSRPPGKAFPDASGRVLTDGYVGLASFWGLANINLSGKKNKGRVGELVVWEPGKEVVVTLDLGDRRTVGAARVCAVQPNEKVLYPSRIVVETSADGASFTKAGETTWEACFFPPGDQMQWEGTDSPIYEHLPAGGIIDFKFPVLFKLLADARYVRFRLQPPAGGKAGIGLWELEVYESVIKAPWSERLRLPEPPKE